MYKTIDKKVIVKYGMKVKYIILNIKKLYG